MRMRQRAVRGASDFLSGGGDNSHLESDQGRASDLLVAGAMAAMFFTPLGGKIFSGAFRGLRGGAKFAGRQGLRATKAVSKAISKIDIKEAAIGTKRAALGMYKGTATAARRVGATADFLSKNRRLILPVVFGGAVIAGTTAAITGDERGEGPETYTSFENGMPADNLGATGDLTLALHKRRR